MRLTVAGCWAPYPAAGGACSCYLVDTGNSKILLDMGHGSFSKLQQVMDFRQLDMAIVSHFHPDHWGDSSCLRHAINGAINDGSRQGKLPVYVPKEPGEDYQRALKMTDGLEIIPVDDLMDTGVSIPGGSISFFKANHPLPAVSIIVEHYHKKLVYSGDTGESKELVDKAYNSDLLVCEASLVEQDQEYGLKRGHLTASQAASVAKAAKVKQLVLTHLWPEYDMKKLHNEAKAVFPGAILAVELLSLEV